MIRRSLFALIPIATSLVAVLPACNAITGVNGLEVGGGGGGMNVPPPMIAAQGLTIREIAVYQGVKRSVFGGVAPTSNVTVPIVAGRTALMRVFVDVDAGYDQTEVTARLHLGAETLEVKGTAIVSTDENIGSTFNFDIPGEKVVAGLKYQVELLQPPGHGPGTNTASAHPATGTEALDVQSDGMQLKIKIVPIRYGADGSNRLPDTSDAQLQGYKDYFYNMYPARDVEITVRDPMPWDKVIDPQGFGWDTVLDALATQRQKDKAPPDVYYFGAFEPTATFNEFCGGFGCVAGLGLLGDPTDTYSRAAVGVGYKGDVAWTTAIHETGHNHGRQHAPCGGAQNVDPKFPYKDGSIGVWGWNLTQKKLIAPKQGKDVMGYCDPYWISDYTYKALFDRIKFVNKASVEVPAAMRNRVWDRARLDADGHLTWLEPLQMENPPRGESTSVTVLTKGVASVVEGQLYTYDHLPGGILFWLAPKGGSAGVQVTVQGKTATLSR